MKTGPKPRESGLYRWLERFDGEKWVRIRPVREFDFDDRGRLMASLQMFGPARTVTVYQPQF